MIRFIRRYKWTLASALVVLAAVTWWAAVPSSRHWNGWNWWYFPVIMACSYIGQMGAYETKRLQRKRTRK